VCPVGTLPRSRPASALPARLQRAAGPPAAFACGTSRSRSGRASATR